MVAVRNLSFIPLSSFSYLDPRLTAPLTLEIFTGKNGATLTTGPKVTYKLVQIEEGGLWVDRFDDVDAGQDLVSSVTVGGATFPAGTQADVGYYLSVDTTGDGVGDTRLYSVMMGNTIVGFVSDKRIFKNTTMKVVGGSDIAHVRYADMAVCFTDDAMIATPYGEVPVAQLKAGDLILTQDCGPVPIRWIGSELISPERLRRSDKLRPIHIKAGALGGDVPAQPITLSRQHRVLLRSAVVQRMCGEDEVFVAAKDLLDVEGVSVVKDCKAVTYYHIACDRHEVVIANGMPTETLLFGKEALKALPFDQRAELEQIFPDLFSFDQCPAPARAILRGSKLRNLIKRHQRNRKDLVA